MTGAGDSLLRQEATPTPQSDDAQKQEQAVWERRGISEWIPSDLPGDVESPKCSAVTRGDWPIIDELCDEFGRLRIR